MTNKANGHGENSLEKTQKSHFLVDVTILDSHSNSDSQDAESSMGITQYKRKDCRGEH